MIFILISLGLLVVPISYKEYKNYVEINGENRVYSHAAAAFMALGIVSSILMVYSYFMYPHLFNSSWMFREL